MTTPTFKVLVRRLGRVRYLQALSLQQSLASHYKDVEQGQVGEVVLCEHHPVFTFGLREVDFHAKAADMKEKLVGCDVYKLRRGGLTTFHGPGQLVCYPILNLRKLKIGVKDYVCCLEKCVVSTLSSCGVEGFTTTNTGVWVNHPIKGESKICAIGIQVSHGVTFHGLALNCSTDLSWFSHITPCGVEGKGVTSLTEILQRTVRPDHVDKILIQTLAKTLKFEVM